MKFKYHFLAVIMLFILPQISSSQTSSNELEYRKYRVSLFPPLSSNGSNAVNYNAKYSLNIIAGYNGGLEGFEIGPVNINKHFSRGVQIGAFNMTGGDMSGLHFAGLANIAGEDISGLQFAGLFNASKRDIEGIQAAGIGNIANGEISGIQFGGIFNAANGDISGIQFGGIANLARGEISGVQFAGIVNAAHHGISGMQYAGIVNFAAGNFEGIQIAGVVNANNGYAQGLIFAGGANFSTGSVQGIVGAGGFNYSRDLQGIALSGGFNITESMQGIQVAGLLNVAQTGQGIQIAPFNFAKDFEGLPVGLISWYDNGRKNIDIWANENGFANIGLKTGTHHVYNMISVGYNTIAVADEDVWSLGWTIGIHRQLDELWNRPALEGYFLNQDFGFYHIQEGKYRSDLNHVYSYRYLLGREFSKGFSAYAGPTLNMHITREGNNRDYINYDFYNRTSGGRDYRFWLGLTVGIQAF